MYLFFRGGCITAPLHAHIPQEDTLLFIDCLGTLFLDAPHPTTAVGDLREAVRRPALSLRLMVPQWPDGGGRVRGVGGPVLRLAARDYPFPAIDHALSPHTRGTLGGGFRSHWGSSLSPAL